MNGQFNRRVRTILRSPKTLLADNNLCGQPYFAATCGQLTDHAIGLIQSVRRREHRTKHRSQHKQDRPE